jgi:mannosyltransferase
MTAPFPQLVHPPHDDAVDPSPGPWLPAALITLLGGLVFGWRAGRSGLWRDEAATMATLHRSLGDLFALSGNVDLVHLPYYLLARIAWFFDESVTSVRWISVIAMSLAAGTLVLIGRRLGSVWFGTLAGLLLVASPFASRYAQEARPFAVVTLLATACSYAFLRLAQQPTRRGQLLYAVTVVLLGLFNVLALMLVVAHAAYLYLAGEPELRRRWSEVTVAGLAGLAVLLPWVLATMSQRGQVSWIVPPRIFDLRAQATNEFGSRLAPAVVIAAVLLLLLVRWILVRRQVVPGPVLVNRTAVLLGAAWGLLPVALLWIVSQAIPLWDGHYLTFTVPGLALLLAGFVPGLERPRFSLPVAAALTVPVLLLAGLGAHAQLTQRDPIEGHGENLQLVADYLSAHKQTDDAVLFAPNELRILTEVYPQDFIGLDDVSLARTGVATASLVGTPIAAGRLPGSLLPHQRVWLMRGLYGPPDEPGNVTGEILRTLAENYRQIDAKTVTDVRLTLYERD